MSPDPNPVSKGYTEDDVDQLAGLVRARIGWPISAGEAGTIVAVVLQELAGAGRLREPAHDADVPETLALITYYQHVGDGDYSYVGSCVGIDHDGAAPRDDPGCPGGQG